MSAIHTGELVPPPPRSGVDFPALDTLRFVGALCVLTTHVAFWAGDYTRHGALGTLLARLDVGVALFFVLSGFLLSRPWLLAASERRPGPAVTPYLWKRGLRIVPLYMVTVVVALGLISENASLSWSDRLTTLFMLDTFVDPSLPAGLTHMWSLAVEVTFYLLLPLLMLLALGRDRGLRPARVLAVLVAMTAITAWWHLAGATLAGKVSEGSPLQWLPAYLLWFALGILLALVHVLRQHARWRGFTDPFVTLARLPGVCWALVAGLMLIAATPLAGPSMFESSTPAQSLTKCVIYAAVGLLAVLPGVFADGRGTWNVVMSHPVGRRLGWISFGLFCLHLPVLHLVMWLTPWQLFEGNFVGLWVTTLGISLLVAELSYRAVERPAMRLRRLVGNHRPRPATSRPTKGTSIR